MKFAVCSKRGQKNIEKNKVNQDYTLVDADFGLYILCDGMGGHAAGELASSEAAEFLMADLKSKLEKLTVEAEILEQLNESAFAANQFVLDYATKDELYNEMGTTVVIAYCVGSRLYLCHVGDSRAYLLSKGRLRQLTKDHSYVQGLVDKGQIRAEEARFHPLNNMINQALGTKGGIEPTIASYNFGSGALVLLCSDGISDNLSRAEIKAILLADEALEQRAEALVERAFANYGKDDASVILIAKNELGEG